MPPRPHACLALALLLDFFSLPVCAQVVNSEWNTGNGNWNVLANWSPADVPDNGGGLTYNVQIGNRAVANSAAVTFVPEDGTADTVSSLVLSNEVDLFTNGNQLNIVGQTTVDSSNSILRIDAHNIAGTASLTSANLDLNNGGVLSMNNGVVNVNTQLEINSSSALSGFGVVNVGDTDATVEQAFENSGSIQPQSSLAVFRTLTIHANGVDTIDLDGDSESGVVNVANTSPALFADSLTLVIDGPLADAFGGTLQIGQRDTVTFSQNFTMSGAAVTMTGGNSLATLDGPAQITSIASSTFTISGAAVISNDLTFTGTANTITIPSGASLTLDGTVTIPDASALSLTDTAQLIVNGETTITEPGADFNWSANGNTVTTVNGTGHLTVDVGEVALGTNIYTATINLNDGGELTVNVAASSWRLAGVLNKNGAGGSSVTGDAIDIQGFGQTAEVNVNAGTLTLPVTTLASSGMLKSDGLLNLSAFSVLAGGFMTGSGTVRMVSTSTVSANTIVGVNTFDWDGTGAGSLQTINDGAALTINSSNFDDDGDMDDPVSLGGNGAQLIVNHAPQWTMLGTLTANSAAAGTATIGGTSAFVLASAMNVHGNTDVTAPMRFETGANVSIDAGKTLHLTGDVTYEAGTIGGAGTFMPSAFSTITGNITINAANLAMDSGSPWVVDPGASLTIDVTDYLPGPGPNLFSFQIVLHDGDCSVATGDPEFVMNGNLTMQSTIAGQTTEWSGEPIDIGNDADDFGVPAHLFVSGSQVSRFNTEVDFNSDAIVTVASGATLELREQVNFSTRNGSATASFTGPGIMRFNGPINVNESVFLDFTGGTVDLDGTDFVGDVVTVDAPFTINAQTFGSFGKDNFSGTNTLEVRNGPGTGKLTVNLDTPGAFWTLNALGVMNLINTVGMGSPPTLLAGSGLNINGTVNVTGDLNTTALVNIAGSVNIATSSTFRMKHSVSPFPPSLISGGTVNGPGTFAAENGNNLSGYGTINAPIAFNSGASIIAHGGLLNLNGSILDLFQLTIEAGATANLGVALDTSVSHANIQLTGGLLQGAAITLNTIISGFGTVSNNINNEFDLIASGGSLVLTNSASDWDGVSNSGQLRAVSSGVLDVRDNSFPNFAGKISADTAGTVYLNGFETTLTSASLLTLAGGGLQSTHPLHIAGEVQTLGVTDSNITVPPGKSLDFLAFCTASLAGNLSLVSTNITIAVGVNFSGAGALRIAAGSHAVLDPNVNLNIQLENYGTYRLCGNGIVGTNHTDKFQQFPGAQMILEFTGTAVAQFDRLTLNSGATLAGTLSTDIDGTYLPTLGQTFQIITTFSGTISGAFDRVLRPEGMANNMKFKANYLARAVELIVVADTYWPWINSFPGLTPLGSAALDKAADPDGDGLTNLGEFAIDGDPSKGGNSGKMVAKIGLVGGVKVFTYTIPVRSGATPSEGDPAGGPLLLEQTVDGVTYSIEAADNIGTWTLDVTEVTGADASNIQTGLPPLSAGWVYRTFRSPGPVAGDPADFMRVVLGGDYVNGSGS